MKISLIVPCRNERLHIRDFVESVQTFQVPADSSIEVLVADGNSTDGTREFLNEYCAAHDFVRVIDNPGQIVSTGLNRALALACGEVILRLDVHADYARIMLSSA